MEPCCRRVSDGRMGGPAGVMLWPLRRDPGVRGPADGCPGRAGALVLCALPRWRAWVGVPAWSGRIVARGGRDGTVREQDPQSRPTPFRGRCAGVMTPSFQPDWIRLEQLAGPAGRKRRYPRRLMPGAPRRPTTPTRSTAPAVRGGGVPRPAVRDT